MKLTVEELAHLDAVSAAEKAPPPPPPPPPGLDEPASIAMLERYRADRLAGK